MHLLRLFFLFVVLGCGTLFLVKKLSFSQFAAPFVTIVGTTSALYVFSLFNFLKQGLIFIVVLLLILGVFSFLKWPFKSKSEKFQLTPPLVTWIFIFLFLAVYTVGTLFYEWDEFSYWGVIFRYLMATNHLPDLASNMLINTYPPFTALIQYFVGSIVGNFESSAYLAQMLLSFSAVIALIPNNKWNDWKKYIVVLGLCILSVFPFGLTFQSLYVDVTLGLLFGVGLTSSVFNDNCSRERISTLILASIALILTKPLGIFFASICICVLFVDLLIKNNPTHSISGIIRSAFRILIKPQFLILVGISLFAFLSWNFHSKQFNNTKINFSINANPVTSSEIYPGDPASYLASLNEQSALFDKKSYVLNQPVEINISLASVLRTFTVNIPYRTKLIIQNFINTISMPTFGIVKISPLNALFIILFISLLIQITLPITHRKESNLPQNTIIIFIGFIIYCFALLFAYIYYFPPISGIDAPCLSRYLASYLLGWWFLIICMLYQQKAIEIPGLKIQVSNIIITILVFVLVLTIPLSAYIHSPNTPDDSRRFEVNRISKAITNIITREDKIYDVWQVDSYFGLSHFMMKYNLTPIATNNFGWRLSPTFSEEDIKVYGNTTEMSPSEWLELLIDQHYTYVLINTSDTLFWKEYGSLFTGYEDKNTPQLFSVTSSGLINVPIKIKY